MSTRDEIREKAREIQVVSDKLHDYARYLENLADKVEELEKQNQD